MCFCCWCGPYLEECTIPDGGDRLRDNNLGLQERAAELRGMRTQRCSIQSVTRQDEAGPCWMRELTSKAEGWKEAAEWKEEQQRRKKENTGREARDREHEGCGGGGRGDYETFRCESQTQSQPMGSGCSG